MGTKKQSGVQSILFFIIIAFNVALTALFPFPVSAASITTYDDSNININYRGSWIVFTGAKPKADWEGTLYQSSMHYSTKPGNKIFFSFTGRELSLIYSRGPKGGSIGIQIDYQSQIILDRYKPAPTVTQQKWTLLSFLQETILLS